MGPTSRTDRHWATRHTNRKLKSLFDVTHVKFSCPQLRWMEGVLPSFHRGICLIRNPFCALVAMTNQGTSKNHTGFAPKRTFASEYHLGIGPRMMFVRVRPQVVVGSVPADRALASVGRHVDLLGQRQGDGSPLRGPGQRHRLGDARGGRLPRP